jgi:glycosyltransferase involved in cell wall biosynthesis
MGHDVTVVTTRDSDDLPRREETDGYSVVRVPKGATIAGNDVSPWILKEVFARADDYDVVHAHSHLYFATNVAALNRRVGDVPLAITNHGLYSQSAPESIFGLYLKTGARWTFNQADVVFCYTDTDKQRVRSLGVGSRIEVVPNGIDTNRFTPEGPESELIDHDGPVVLFVGRLVESKRPGDAIAAFERVLDEVPDAQLYFCGEGQLREELELNATDCGIRDRVSFLGHVPYDEMPRVYRSGDVLVLPSRAESVPRTVLESISSGIPVVVNDLPQVRDVVGDRGTTTETTDSAGCADRIVEWIGRPIDGSLQETHSWAQTVDRTTDVVESIDKAVESPH